MPRTTTTAAPMPAQVYLDPRPAEFFTPAHQWARTHRPDGAYDAIHMLAVPLLSLAFRARTIDLQNVPGSGPAILAPNHFSAMDHYFAAVYLRRRVRFMAKSQLFVAPIAWLIRHAGAFPVRRGQQDEEAIRTAESLLGGGGVVVIYPEGGRSRSAEIGQRARPGVGRLALDSGAPVVPVAIDGSERIRNWKRGVLPRVTIRYGEPMRFQRTPDSTREHQQQVADQVLAEIARLHDGLAAVRR